MSRFTALAALAIALAVSACGGGDATYEVTYHVLHSDIFGGKSFVTYAPAEGAASQLTVTGSWTSGKRLAKASEFLYVSAQNAQSTGTVYVTIKVDGKDFRSASGNGGFAIATASGTCC